MKYVTELNLTNDIILSSFAVTEEESVNDVINQLPLTTHERTYTISDIMSIESFELPHFSKQFKQ
jgi:hypothetical protein